jgi:hypothetical protein
MAVLTGKAAFVNLTETEQYQGQDTGRYTLTVTLDDSTAEMLSNQGVKLRDYEGTPQRKFSSRYPVKVIDADDNPFVGSITRGSTIRLSYKTGPAHPIHGTPTYLNAVRVVELADDAGIDDEL